MENVDKIIISSIKEIGCDIGDDVHNLKQCNVENIVQMTVHCLKTIKPDITLPTVLPQSMSARFNMCAKVAQLCVDFGYKGEVGYHTFLYFNEIEVRKILVFLIENLPRDIYTQHAEEVQSNTVSVRYNVRKVLKEILQKSEAEENVEYCHTPFVSSILESGTLLPGQKIDCKPQEWKNFVINQLPFISEQTTNYQHFLPSVITLNLRGILHPRQLKCSQLYRSQTPHLSNGIVNTQTLTFNCRPSVFPFIYNLRDCIAQSGILLQSNIVRKKGVENAGSIIDGKCRSFDPSTLENLKTNISNLSFMLAEIQKRINAGKKHTGGNNISKRGNVIKHSLKLLPDINSNLSTLVEVNAKLSEKIAKAVSKWQEHQQPIVQKYSQLRNQNRFKMDEKDKLSKALSEIREELHKTVVQIQKKCIVEQRLSAYQKTVKGIRRSEYTLRILEIIGNIKKQDKEIDKILTDAKELQKDVNSLTGKISRSFALADKLLSMYSREDEFSQEAYSLLLELRKAYEDIIDMVSETGATIREAKNMEEQISEYGANVKSIDEISMDIQKIKVEQSFLKQQLQNLAETEQKR